MLWSGPAVISVSHVSQWSTLRQSWLCCTVHKVLSWCLCAASRLNWVLVSQGLAKPSFRAVRDELLPIYTWGCMWIQWISCPVVTYWKNVCNLGTASHPAAPAPGGLCEARCSACLLPNETDWLKIKIFFFCDYVDGTAWHKLGLNSLVWAVHLAYWTA